MSSAYQLSSLAMESSLLMQSEICTFSLWCDVINLYWNQNCWLSTYWNFSWQRKTQSTKYSLPSI